MFFHREGKKNHMAVRSLCYRTLGHSGALWATLGPSVGGQRQGGGHPWVDLRQGCRVLGMVTPWWSSDLAPECPPLGLAPISSQQGLEGRAQGFWLLFAGGE